MKTHALAPYLQRFFTERLGTQLKASPNTIISYRDTFRLLLRYVAEQLQKAPTALQIADIDAETDLCGEMQDRLDRSTPRMVPDSFEYRLARARLRAANHAAASPR